MIRNHLTCLDSPSPSQLFAAGGFLATVALLLIGPGCASNQARKRLEGVAKNWCETIRASQVIPVYPLTQDLLVGDVFLVQTPIANQASDYEAKGFLPLDDAKVRLPYTNFSKIYFDGYWKDEFGQVPHPLPGFTNAGNFSATQAVSFSAGPLPRAAFPSYSFQAQGGFGLNAAFPIQGVPVALSYLNSSQVDGSVTIADARTYAGDADTLLDLLRAWADTPSRRQELADLAQAAAPRRIFLRVVSRVYYARSLDVTLHRSNAQGAGGKGGVVNDVTLLNSNGSVNQDYTNVLNALTAAVAGGNSPAQVGAATRFVSASASTVGLSQTFDALLAIGYLGIDVPVDPSGELGAPIPTFEHLTRRVPEATTAFGQGENTPKIRAWLRHDPANLPKLQNWLNQTGRGGLGITTILYGGAYFSTRRAIVAQFNIP